MTDMVNLIVASRNFANAPKKTVLFLATYTNVFMTWIALK